MPKPVRRLSNMEIDEISLVDKGANEHAMITIAKRAPEEEEMPELYTEDGNLLDENSLEDGDIVFDEDGNAYEFSVDEDGEYEPEEEEAEPEPVGKAFEGTREAGRALKSGYKIGRAARAAGKGTEGGVNWPSSQLGRAYGKKSSGRRWAERGVSAGINRNQILGGAGAAGAAGGGAYGYKHHKDSVGKSFSEGVMEELSKAFSDDERDQVIAKALGRVEELENKYSEAEEIAKSERDLRLTREYIAKAADYNLPVDPNELGPVLYRMAETMDYDDCAVIAKCLEGAGAMIFDEQGYIGGGDNQDIMSAVEARASEEIGKSAGASDITSVFDQTPEAYDEYLASQRGNY